MLEAGLSRLRQAIVEACDLLAERTHGNPARSPGHNARLKLERALAHSQSPAESADLIDGIRFAINQLSEHIEEHHDFDYQPHQVPAELASLRGIQHHLEGCLIKDDGSAVRSQPAAPAESPSTERDDG
jgi:hypothetical protein